MLTIKQHIEINLGGATLEAANRFLNLAERIVTAIEKANQPKGGIKFMFVVKDTNPDVGYSITAPAVTDSEGNAIPDAQLTYEVASSDENVVGVIAGSDPKTGTVHFGAPGVAAVTVQVKSGETLLGSFAANFTVTTGDPSAITGGSIAFDGLTES